MNPNDELSDAIVSLSTDSTHLSDGLTTFERDLAAAITSHPTPNVQSIQAAVDRGMRGLRHYSNAIEFHAKAASSALPSVLQREPANTSSR